MNTNPKKVMIIDDNHLSAEGINKNISWSSLNLEVYSIEYDALSALEVIDQQKIDIVISDIQMPGINGLELSKKILENSSTTKIILVSAYDKFEYAKEGLRLGVFDYIEKPINYTYLIEIIQNAITQIDVVDYQNILLEKSRPAIISNFFSTLINYPFDEDLYSLTNYPDYLGIRVNYNFYTVIVISIENFSSIKDQYGIHKYHLELLQLQENINKMVQSYDLHYVLNDLHQLVCILGHNNHSKKDFHKSIHHLTHSISVSNDNSLIEVNLGIGTVAKNIWDIHISYKSSCRALDHRFFYPQKKIFDAQDSVEKNFSIHLFSENKENQLIQFICKKDYNAITLWLHEFIDELPIYYHTKNLVFNRIYSLLGRILKLLYEMDIDSSLIEKEIVSMYSSLDTITHINELFEVLNNICYSACSELDISTKTYHEQLSNAVIDYIQQNYSNNDLSLNELAFHVNTSPTHLSALFKKTTGTNINEVITDVRIGAACQLLTNTSISLKEISEKIGYVNQYYFSSCFKKKIGCSPSEYRSTR